MKTSQNGKVFIDDGDSNWTDTSNMEEVKLNVSTYLLPRKTGYLLKTDCHTHCGLVLNSLRLPKIVIGVISKMGTMKSKGFH